MQRHALNAPLRLPALSGVRLSECEDVESSVEKLNRISSRVASFSTRRALFSRRWFLFFTTSSRNFFARSPGPADCLRPERPSSSMIMSATSSSSSRWKVFAGGISVHGSAEDMRCLPRGCLGTLGFIAARVITVTCGGAQTRQS
jgi:hypothetical protein